MRDNGTSNANATETHGSDSQTSGFTAAGEQAMAVSRRQNSYQELHPDADEHDAHSTLSPPHSPPLLLEPPPTRVAALCRTVVLFFFRLCNALGVQPATVYYTFRVSLFLAKLGTLVRPCWPYLPKLEVGTPLVIIATLDLARYSLMPHRSPSYSAYWTSVVLLGFHFVVLLVARRWDTLCLNFNHEWTNWGE